MKRDGIICCTIFLCAMMVSAFLSLIGLSNYGLAVLAGGLILGLMGLLVAIKLHGRYVQNLILLLNNKTFEETCDCKSCLEGRQQV